MKKLSLLLALALLLSLAGCGSTDTGLLEGVTPAGAGCGAAGRGVHGEAVQ